MAYLTSGKNKIMGSSVSTDTNVVTVIDDTCTDEQVPSAKAVYDKLNDLPTDSGSKCYTTLSELGLTADATIEDVVNALKNGESFLAPVNTFTNYETIFPNKLPNDQWNKVHIIKGASLASSHIRCFSQSGTCEYLANVNNTNVVSWNDASGTYIDISDSTIEKLGSEILKYPVGKYRINSTTTGNKFTDLPSNAETKCGLIEINGTAVGKSPFTDTWVYRMYKFECLTGTTSYIRRLNSGATVGQIEVDTGWQIENPPAQQVYSNTPIGTVLSFAGLTPPNGYLLCDGSSYAVADYQDLYYVIGNTYGGDSEYFNVPNLIDKFIQGSDTSGTEKEAGLPNIEGVFTSMKSNGQSQSSTGFLGVGAFSRYGNKGANQTADGDAQTYIASYKFNARDGEAKTDGTLKTDDEHRVYGNSDTVQPPALTMVYIIKAFYTNEGVDAPVELKDSVINHIDNQIDNYVNNQIDNRIDNRIDGRLDELFQSVSDGKTLVANAITDKGVSTSSTDTFATMASNIRNITTVMTYKSERKSGSVEVKKSETATISISFSNTVIGVTKVDYDWSSSHLSYEGFSVSGNTVKVNIEVSSSYAYTYGSVSCTVSANILA